MVTDKMYSPNEVAQLLGVSAQSVRHWVREGNMNCYRKGVGQKTRIQVSQEQLDDFVKKYMNVQQ